MDQSQAALPTTTNAVDTGRSNGVHMNGNSRATGEASPFAKCSLESCSSIATDSNVTSCNGCKRSFCLDHVSSIIHHCPSALTQVVPESTAKPQFEPCSKCSQFKRSLDSMIDQNENLKRHLEDGKDENYRLRRDIQYLESKLFESEQELLKANKDRETLDVLKTENSTLFQRSLVLGEMYSKTKEKLDSLNSNHFIHTSSNDSLMMRISSLEKELEKKSKELLSRTREVDCLRAKALESDAIVDQKEKQVHQLTCLIKKIQDDHKIKMNIEQERIAALERSRDFYEKRILDMNEARGLPINSQLLHALQNSRNNDPSFSSSTNTTPATSAKLEKDTQGDQDSDSYIELSNSPPL